MLLKQLKPMSLELRIKNYTFTPKLIPIILAIILVPILVSLGFWQLERANEKRVIDKGVNEAIAKPALELNNTDLAILDDEIYRAATITGQFDDKQQYLLDNRTNKGKPGYHVISPFIFEQNLENISSKYAVLINRGWISYQGTRDKISNIELDKETKKITGSIKKIPKSIVLKHKNGTAPSNLIFKSEGKQLKGVSLIQSIQMDRFEENLDYELLPIIIELDKTVDDGFVREWQPYFGSIDKHNAYAVQWFAMAVILLFLLLKLNIRKR